jgi:hypothetical protein
LDADHILRDSPILALFQSLSGESGWESYRLAGGFDRGGEFAVLALKFRGLAGAPWSYATYRGKLNPNAYQTNRRCEVTRKILCGPGSTRTSRVGLVATINDLVDGERS